MKALRWDGGSLFLIERGEPEQSPGRAVVRVHLAGICNMDLAPIVINEIAVVGSRCGPFTPAIRALAEGSPAGPRTSRLNGRGR